MASLVVRASKYLREIVLSLPFYVLAAVVCHVSGERFAAKAYERAGTICALASGAMFIAYQAVRLPCVLLQPLIQGTKRARVTFEEDLPTLRKDKPVTNITAEVGFGARKYTPAALNNPGHSS
ncbi:hypothetical protein WJX81_003346 [Elliptochloris bilobata]|uniref:Uncharacterized protein n=1 Tax=Elliptochloris bilobata TaxID=381761 RepID=A0AAW1SH97_9CHLO